MNRSDSPNIAAMARDVFIEAIKHRDGQERSAYINAICGTNADLRAEVESLLAVAGTTEKFLETDPTGQVIDPLDGLIGTVIGRYKILEWIGEGGFAEVYRVEQIEPIRREVALKIIKPGMDSREVIARFEAERQALALMEHPNIAQVFDAGTTQLGRPYFVMELVRGVPITAFCDDQQIPIPDRLQLIQQVCGGVQHAHQKGVLHRDLKPSNIVVTRDPSDGQPIPKIIDFGIAKSLQVRLTEKTLVSRQAVLLGTPSYMSPEQLDLDSENLDTRTDVYALGILLYELLAGARPFDRETLERASFSEIFRLIREVEPPMPSARIEVLDGDLESIARARSIDPGILVRTIRGDLDWITMKSIEKDRDRRYPSAGDLAADLERHRTHLPVLAGPPGRVYRMQKFVRRHRVGVAAAAAVALAIALGLSAAFRSYQNEVAQRHLAEAARARSQELVNFILKDQQPKLASSGNRQEIMDSAMAAVRYYEQLPQELRDEATIREHAAALQTLVDTVGWNFQSLFDEKGPRYWDYAWEQGGPIWRQIAETDPGDGEAAANALFAELNSTNFINRSDALTELLEMEKRFPETIALQIAIIRVSRGTSVMDTGPVTLSLVDDARTRTTRLVAKHPDHDRLKSEHITNHWASGIVYDREGQHEKGIRFMEAGWAIAEDLLATDPTHWGFLVLTIHMLDALTSNFDQTERQRGERARQAIERLQAIKTIEPKDPYWWHLSSKQLYNDALANFQDRNYLSADTLIQSAINEIEAVPLHYFQQQWWIRYIGLAGVIAARFEGSRFNVQDCLSQLQDGTTLGIGAGDISWADINHPKLPGDGPSRPVNSWELRYQSFMRDYFAVEILDRLEDWAEMERIAEKMLSDVRVMITKFAEAESTGSGCRAISQAFLGKALLKQGAFAKARPWLESAVERSRAHGSTLPRELTPWRPWEAAENLGLILQDAGEMDAVIDVLEWAFTSNDEYIRTNDALSASRIRTAGSAWALARALTSDEPAQTARRTEVLRRAAELLDDPSVQSKLLPDELAMRETIGEILDGLPPLSASES